MRRSDQDSTMIVRTWLDEGSTQLSPRVHDAVLREFPGINQDGAFGTRRLRMTGYAATVAAVVVVAVVGVQFLAPPGSVGPGAGQTASSPLPSEPSATQDPVIQCDNRFGMWRDMPQPPVDFGLIGFPPEGAAPSLPLEGELVDSYWVHGGEMPYRGMARLYADGRLIWNYANLPDSLPGDDLVATGYVVQRLTPEGVEFVRAQDLSLKDPMVLNYCLPEGAWADQTYRPYVPTNYAACLEVQSSDGSQGVRVGLPAKLAMLPAPARDLLEGNDLASVEEDSYGPSPHCLALTLPEARALDAALQDIGLVPGWDGEEWSMRPGTLYHLDVGSDQLLVIFFEPVFPHGQVSCSYCG